MTAFGLPKKLRNLTRICIDETQYQIKVDLTTSETFTVKTGLKQGDALFPILFNLVLEKAVSEMQKMQQA